MIASQVCNVIGTKRVQPRGKSWATAVRIARRSLQVKQRDRPASRTVLIAKRQVAWRICKQIRGGTRGQRITNGKLNVEEPD